MRLLCMVEKNTNGHNIQTTQASIQIGKTELTILNWKFNTIFRFISLEAIRKVAERLKIPVIANGGSRDIENYKDVLKFREECGTTSVMIARAAEWNVSIFRKEGNAF